MDFSITSKLDKGDYIKVMFIGLYKKPYYIIATIFGLCLLIISILNYVNELGFEVYSSSHTKKFGYFIDKSKLTSEELLFIKSKIIKK